MHLRIRRHCSLCSDAPRRLHTQPCLSAGRAQRSHHVRGMPLIIQPFHSLPGGFRFALSWNFLNDMKTQPFDSGLLT